MTEAHKTALIALAAFLWSIVGVLAGAVLAMALGIEGRPVAFFAAVGLAVGWFGFSGSRISIASLDAPAKKYRNVPSDKAAQERRDPNKARQWLDDFLVKQQRK